VGEPARTHAPTDDVPIADPEAIRRAYRLERAKRRTRLERTHAKRLAGFRFAASIVILLVLSAVLTVTIWHQVQRLFGL
jgi:hypothetical protein